MSDALEEQAGIENGTDIDLPALAEQLSGGEISRQEQAQIIENSDVPEIFKEYLQENNNKEIYSMIGADSFADYIAKGITRLIIQILTAVVLFFRHIGRTENCYVYTGCSFVASDHRRNQPDCRSSPWTCDGADFYLDCVPCIYAPVHNTGRGRDLCAD